MSDPSRYDMTIYRGQTFSRKFFYKNPDGSAIDMTGWTAEFSAKGSLSIAAEAINLTDGSGTSIDVDEGSISIDMTNEQTAALTHSCLYHTLKLLIGGEPYPLLFGKLTISDEVF